MHHRLIPAFTRKQRIRRLARKSLIYHGRMHYDEGPRRSDLFHRERGNFNGAHADCSQFSASLCHWVGVKDVDDKDWTGTLGKKGVRIEEPVRGASCYSAPRRMFTWAYSSGRSGPARGTSLASETRAHPTSQRCPASSRTSLLVATTAMRFVT